MIAGGFNSVAISCRSSNILTGLIYTGVYVGVGISRFFVENY